MVPASQDFQRLGAKLIEIVRVDGSLDHRGCQRW